MAKTPPRQIQNLPASALKVGSSIAALVVHTVDEDGAYVSPGAGSTQVSVKEILTSSGASVMDSSNASIGVTIRAGSAAGTEYADGDTDATPNFGAVGFSNGTNTMRVVSASTPLPVTASTTVAVSSLSGAVNMRSSAANALVTIYQSTFTDLNVRINAPSTGNSSNYLPVRITDGTSFVSPGAEYSDGSTHSTMTGPGLLYNNSSNQTMRLVGVSQPLPVQFRTSSGAEMADSTETALRVNIVAGAAAGSTLVTVRQSTASDLRTMATQASTTWAVQLSNYSTTVNVSSLGGAVIVRSSAADQLVTAYQSTASAFLATVYQSTASALQATARVNTSSGGGVEGSTGAPASGALGLHVRQVYPAFASVYSTVVSTASSAFYEVVSSAAGITRCVFAERVTSPATAALLVEFKQSTGTTVFHTEVGSGSSGVVGGNLATSFPSRLFQSAAAGNITVRLGSTGVEAKISLSYFNEI